MSYETEHRSLYVPDYWSGDPAEHSRKIAFSVNNILRGMTNNHFTVTLEVDPETETVIPFEPCRAGMAIILSPKTASAATAYAAGNVYAESFQGEAKVFHDASAATDRIFYLIFVG